MRSNPNAQAFKMIQQFGNESQGSFLGITKALPFMLSHSLGKVHDQWKYTTPLQFIGELPFKDFLYPIPMPDPSGTGKSAHKSVALPERTKKNNRVEEWHKKLGHIFSDRIFAFSESGVGISKFTREEQRSHECVPSLTAKSRKAHVQDSKRKTYRHLWPSRAIVWRSEVHNYVLGRNFSEVGILLAQE